MTLDTFELLLAPAGQSALAAATALAPTDRTHLQAMTGLRKQFSPQLAAIALETVILRGKAAGKFRLAARMYFTREALEVASGEVIAAYRAERFRGYGAVGDFGCGIGGDTLALAADGRTVEAVDNDPVRVRMAEANAAACGLADRVRVRHANLLDDPLPDVPAAFADPGRRADGRRFLSIDDYLPPPASLVKLLPRSKYPIAFKLAPGVNRDEVTPFGGELEFVSVDGELKESVLWCGELRTNFRRATLLSGRPHPPAPSPSRRGGVQGGDGIGGAPNGTPSSQSPQNPLRDGEGGTRSVPGEVQLIRHTYAADTLILPDVARPVGAFLFDPAGALVRAELEGNLAAELGLRPITAGQAVFTGDGPVSSPFLTAYRVEAVLPLDAKRVNAHLTANGIGRITVVQCGSGVDADGISRKCKGKGAGHRFVVLTKELGRPVAVVAERT